MTDIEIIRKCLAGWASFASGFRRAGLNDKWLQTKEAQAALERIAAPKFDWTPKGEKPKEQAE